MDADDLVDTSEMYLKAVLELEEEGVVALRARLADRFEHAGPTVSQTVERLRRDGLVDLATDRHLLLTTEGRRTASQVMRKHRLAEVFLDRVIGLDWELLHEEACRWEHVMSDRVEGLLEQLLERPAESPYGNPVEPGSGVRPGERGIDNLVRLATATSESMPVTIRWIGEPLQADTAALALLHKHGLRPGAKAVIAGHGPSVLVQVGEADVELPHRLAAHLFAEVS